jgi:diacylglycerol kinase (ATP)
MRRLLLVINPHAGSGSRHQFEHVLQGFLKTTAQGGGQPAWHVERLRAEGEPEQTRIALRSQLSQAHWDAVGILGGDGTVMEVLPVLVDFPEVPVLLLAGGTGNLLHANLGIPTQFSDALHLLESGQSRRIDLGRIDTDRYFVLVAGAGGVTEIMENTPRAHKKLFGPLAYVVHGVRTMFGLHSSRFVIETESRRYQVRGMGILVSNAASFMGLCIPFTPKADPQDGWLDVCVVRGRSLTDCLAAVPSLLKPDTHLKARNLVRFRAKKVRIESKPPLKLQADGTPLHFTPVDIEIVPQSLNILVPSTMPQTLPAVIESALLQTVKSLLNIS